jgi:hypothetical protein
MQLESPKYRTTVDHTYLNGAPFRANTVVEFLGWPLAKLRLEPQNESARRIDKYYQANWIQPHFPKGTQHLATAEIFLPGSLWAFDGVNLPATVDIENEQAAMPRYRLDRPNAMFNRRRVIKDQEFALLAWPHPLMMLLPANDSAERVLEYQDRYERHFAFPNLSPWNCLTESLFLPPLS